MNVRALQTLFALCFLPFVGLSQDLCQHIYVWEFSNENKQRNEITKMLTNEVEDALTSTSCLVLQRRNYARLSDQVDSEVAIQSLENVAAPINTELQLIKAKVVLFGQVSQDFTGNIFVRVSFENLTNKQILLSNSMTLVGEEAFNINKRRQKVQAFIMNCVGEKVISNDETHFWQSTKSLNTIEAYNNYLAKYPTGKYVTEAKRIIKDEKEWAEVHTFKSKTKKRRYLKKYVNNKRTRHLEEAHELLQELLWKYGSKVEYINLYPDGKYATEDNIWREFTLATYLKHYPNGKYATEDIILKKGGLKEYLKYFPNGEYATEDYIWKEGGVIMYLNRFPKGKYLAEAEKSLWGKVVAEDSYFDRKDASKVYLKYFPKGKHAEAAKKNLRP